MTWMSGYSRPSMCWNGRLVSVRNKSFFDRIEANLDLKLHPFAPPEVSARSISEINGMAFAACWQIRDQAAQRARDLVCWADSTALVPQQLRQLVDLFADG
jgi:hypothetical protein